MTCITNYTAATKSHKHFCMMFIMSLLLFSLLMIQTKNGFTVTNNESPRILLIGIDAIPYRVMKSLINQTNSDQNTPQLFAGFKGPTAVINTFPSNSHVAWSGLLQPFHVATPLGYEGRYFDHIGKEITGGYTLFDDPTPWQSYFNWRLEGIISTAIAYGWPESYSLTEVDDGLLAFYNSKKSYFSMYIVSTDGIGHTKGPQALLHFLKALDKKLQDFKQQHPDMPFYTVMISDHGMAGGKPLENIYSTLNDTLEKAGYRVNNELENKHDVAVVSFGLLNSFVAYTSEKIKQDVATIASSIQGVDLCVSSNKTGWRVSDAKGYAEIHKKIKNNITLWKYQIISSDPLHYKKLLQTLQAKNSTTKQLWFNDSLWFNVSQAHHFPDALYRLASGFDLVSNPASISCSVSPGYMFGSLLTEYVAIPTVGALQWTHGALHRDASLSFLMSDIPEWQAPAMIRYNQALEFLNRKLHEKP